MLLFCDNGSIYSPVVVACLLLKHNPKMSVDDALDLIRDKCQRLYTPFKSQDIIQHQYDPVKSQHPNTTVWMPCRAVLDVSSSDDVQQWVNSIRAWRLGLKDASQLYLQSQPGSVGVGVQGEQDSDQEDDAKK